MIPDTFEYLISTYEIQNTEIQETVEKYTNISIK